MDTTLTALTGAAGGIQSNMRKVERSAQDVAAATASVEESTELVDSLVDALVPLRAASAVADSSNAWG